MNYKKTKPVNVPEQNVEIDPRSKTTADGAFNYIPTGDKEKVRGTKRMLTEKKKIAMSDAQLLHAERQARGEEAYQGKLLEARQNDYKDEFVLVILSAPIIVLAWGVFSDNPAAMEKVQVFFEHFAALPNWFST